MNSELKAKLNDMFPRGGVKAMSESQVDVMSAVLAAQTMWSDILVEKPSFKVSASNTFVDEAYNFVFGIDTNNADFVKNIRTEVSRHEKLNNTSRRIALSFMSTDKDFELMKKRFPAYYTDTYVKANPKDVLTGKSKIELAIGRCTDAAKIADAHHTSFSQSGYDMEINGNYKKMFEKSIDAKAFGFQPLHYLALALDEKTLKPLRVKEQFWADCGSENLINKLRELLGENYVIIK